jgi:phosphorylcholine metabolism protein LicD
MIYKAERCIADIFPLVEIPFEDGTFYAPKSAHSYLSRMFGDYMQLPKEITVHGNIKWIDTPL